MCVCVFVCMCMCLYVFFVMLVLCACALASVSQTIVSECNHNWNFIPASLVSMFKVTVQFERIFVITL